MDTKKGLFEERYGEATEDREKRRKDAVKQRVTRNFDTGIGQLEDKLIDKEEELDRLLTKIAQGDGSAIIQAAQLQVEIESLKKSKTILADLKTQFFG